MRQRKNNTQESGREEDIPEPSMIQAFYILMGGYVLDVFDEETTPFPNGQTRYILDDEAIEQMARVLQSL